VSDFKPRPGFGGRQPGSGRKPLPVGDKAVFVRLTPDIAVLLDLQRGELSRTEYIRLLLKGGFDV
jgi:hypothetical protein